MIKEAVIEWLKNWYATVPAPTMGLILIIATIWILGYEYSHTKHWIQFKRFLMKHMTFLNGMLIVVIIIFGILAMNNLHAQCVNHICNSSFLLS